MKQQNDLNAIAKFTKGVADATGDIGVNQSTYRLEVAAEELATAAETRTANGYINAANACIKAKADMARMCAVMLQEVANVDRATKDAVAKVNDAAGKMAQSLQRTRDMMGPQVEDRLRQMERFVDCLERMKALEADGTLDRMFSAMKR